MSAIDQQTKEAIGANIERAQILEAEAKDPKTPPIRARQTAQEAREKRAAAREIHRAAQDAAKGGAEGK